MNTPRYASAAAKLLAKHLPHGPVGLPERARSVDTIERAMRSRTRRRAVWFASSAAVSVAAMLALMLWPRREAVESPVVSISVASAGKGAAVRASGGAQQVSSGAELLAGQKLETPKDGGATLRLSTGTDLVLSGSTSFRVDSQGKSERFSLERGELVAHVAKLTDGKRFLVDTPDAQVEVRGTRFRLRVLDSSETCGSGSRTRLEVTEGVVEVRPQGEAGERVIAGQLWPRDCVARADPAPPRSQAVSPASSSSAPRLAVVPRHVAPTAAPTGASAEGVADHDSSLTLQNDLFAQGVALRRQGDVGGALRAYDDLIRRYPSSPLSENAMVERLRIFVASGDARRRDEAKRYLARYPQGFGVAEARRALGDD